MISGLPWVSYVYDPKRNVTTENVLDGWACRALGGEVNGIIMAQSMGNTTRRNDDTLISKKEHGDSISGVRENKVEEHTRMIPSNRDLYHAIVSSFDTRCLWPIRALLIFRFATRFPGRPITM
jgi:hypothetical protein